MCCDFKLLIKIWQLQILCKLERIAKINIFLYTKMSDVYSNACSSKNLNLLFSNTVLFAGVWEFLLSFNRLNYLLVKLSVDIVIAYTMKCNFSFHNMYYRYLIQSHLIKRNPTTNITIKILLNSQTKKTDAHCTCRQLFQARHN